MLLRAPSLLALALLGACATSPRIVAPNSDTEIDLEDLADKLAAADVVVLGEVHDHGDVHRMHQDILHELLQRRPDLAIAMEMFERDVQTTLWQYLAGDMEEPEFLAASRPWPNYDTDYRPVVEWARAKGVPVLAANPPRDLARKVSKEGIAAVAGDPNVARSTTAPKDEYWTSFQESMKSHGGVPDEKTMERFYQAQCLKDDTMAETIVGHLEAARARGERPMVVHICGRGHSDYRRGVVARVQSRMPEARVKVLSVDEVDDPSDRLYRADAAIADWVLVVRKLERPEMKIAVKAAEPMPAEHPGHDAKATPPTAAEAQPAEGERPALGLRPDYEAQDAGLRVAGVTEGGPAAAAGLQEGDLIVGLGAAKVEDMASYVEALGGLKIGEKVEVTVKRGDQTLKLQVVVGSRSR